MLARLGFNAKRENRLYDLVRVLVFHHPTGSAVAMLRNCRALGVLMLGIPTVVDYFRIDPWTRTIHAPNDGDNVAWLTKLESVTALVVLAFLIVGVVSANSAIRSGKTYNDYKIVQLPGIVSVSWALAVIAQPLAFTTMVFFFERVHPNSTYKESTGAIVVISFLFMAGDLLLVQTPMLLEHLPWSGIPIGLYFVFLALYDLGSKKTTYHSIPWLDDPAEAIKTCMYYAFVANVFHAVFIVVRHGLDRFPCMTTDYYLQTASDVGPVDSGV